MRSSRTHRWMTPDVILRNCATCASFLAAAFRRGKATNSVYEQGFRARVAKARGTRLQRRRKRRFAKRKKHLAVSGGEISCREFLQELGRRLTIDSARANVFVEFRDYWKRFATMKNGKLESHHFRMLENYRRSIRRR